jgi:3-dehydroquinate synthase
MSIFQGNIEQILPEYLLNKDYSKIAVIVDKSTKKYCYPRVKSLLPKHSLIVLPEGEEFKNLDNCLIVWNKLTEDNFDRHSLVINLGGGVIGDLGGFCASTYKRGIDFIQIPTTLLSQVDASVGGKLGIDFHEFKNHIGVFTLPQAVLIDSDFLATLSVRELRSGFAEVIKHCLIKDKEKWNQIRLLDFENMPFNDLISHSVEIKKQIVEADPTEKGVRKILNFGHTIGHAVETFHLKKDRLLHGEAIAIGMLCESYLSYTKRMLTEAELNHIEEFIYTVYGLVKIEEKDFAEIADLTSQDKKNKGSQIRASILNGIGQCDYDVVISKQEIIKALKYYSGTF